MSATPLAALAARARAGDPAAWDALVERLNGVVWKTIYSFTLDDADRRDAVAATFLRLFEHLPSIREPEKLPGWVATTARNEVRALLRSRRRSIPLPEIDVPVRPGPDVADGLLDDELQEALRAALVRLRPRDQALMRLLSAEPALSYSEIGRILDMPHGSIGPTRQRCLAVLRRSRELAPFLQALPA